MGFPAGRPEARGRCLRGDAPEHYWAVGRQSVLEGFGATPQAASLTARALRRAEKCAGRASETLGRAHRITLTRTTKDTTFSVRAPAGVAAVRCRGKAAVMLPLGSRRLPWCSAGYPLREGGRAGRRIQWPLLLPTEGTSHRIPPKKPTEYTVGAESNE